MVQLDANHISPLFSLYQKYSAHHSHISILKFVVPCKEGRKVEAIPIYYKKQNYIVFGEGYELKAQHRRSKARSADNHIQESHNFAVLFVIVSDLL